jgi:tetratricopeptide (TPR) repeat protein
MLVVLTSSATAQQNQAHACGSIERAPGGYGPYDYRTQRDKLEIVERFHFTPQVEALIRGQSGYLAQDLSYLMRTSPNHHRGLISIMRFVEREKSSQPAQLQYSIDCYFDRAIRFAPDDTVVRVLFARHLASTGRKEEAKRQLAIAARHAEDRALTHFNIGLAYFDLESYDEALEHAHRARSLGLPRTELEEKLRSKGHWRNP